MPAGSNAAYPSSFVEPTPVGIGGFLFEDQHLVF